MVNWNATPPPDVPDVLPPSDEHEYTVSITVRETFTATVWARTAIEAEAQAWRGQYEDESNGERKWTRVKARRV